MSSKQHRSFTVRLPVELYFEVSDVASLDGKNLNETVNKLLRLGLGKHVDLTEAITRLLMRAATEEEAS